MAAFVLDTLLSIGFVFALGRVVSEIIDHALTAGDHFLTVR